MTISGPTRRTISPDDGTAGRPGGAKELVAAACRRCGSCARECRLLQRSGLPGRIAEQVLSGEVGHLATAFSCSLCRLCTAICPQRLPVAEMFLDLRRLAVREGQGEFRQHLRLLGYERLGASRLLASWLLPKRCTAIFFPGCSLPGIRPHQTLQLFRLLRRRYPGLGMVLDCCHKPSHDLGRQDQFERWLPPKLDRLHRVGVRRIITGCPSCHQLFGEYGREFSVSSVFGELTGLLERVDREEETEYVIHDSCTARFEPEVQAAVRQLADLRGLRLAEMDHNRETTLCCGEGGGAGCPGGTGSSWSGQRAAEAAGRPLLTMCGGCTVRLAPASTVHLVDLLFCPPGEPLAPTKPVPFVQALLNRLLVRKRAAGLLDFP